jgi:hypothetical protein
MCMAQNFPAGMLRFRAMINTKKLRQAIKTADTAQIKEILRRS